MDKFEELKDTYSTLYNYELTRNRLMANIINIEAVGYEISCIISYANMEEQELNNIKINSKTMLDNYGITNDSLINALTKAEKDNILTKEKTTSGYKISLNLETINILEKQVQRRRIYPKLLEREAYDTKEETNGV